MPVLSPETLLHLDSTLRELPLYQADIQCHCPAAEVYKLLEENQLLPGVILLDAGQLKGIVSRRSFFERMSRPFSRELFCKKPILNFYQFLRQDMLVLPGNLSVVVAARQSLQRSPDLLYEPIAVQLDKDIYRLLEVHQLLLAQSMIQKLTMEALQQSQQALAEEKKLEQVTLQSIGDGVITTNAEGRIKAMNPVAERLTGWQTVAARDQLLLEVFRVVTESTREPVPDPVKTTLEEGRTHELASQVLLLAHNGQEFAIQGSVAPIRVRDEQIAGTVLVFRDVTRERALARQLSWQASHDALTGLLNRRRFEQHLEDACTSARLQNHRHTLCCFDLDQFKAVNDTGGHLAGDELLRQISALLQQQVRKTDVFARLGGDEFGLLLLQCSLEKGLGIAHTIHRCVNEFQFPWQEQNFRVGVSIGLAEITSNISSSTVALSWADAACYQAKKQGRNCVRVHEPDEVYC